MKADRPILAAATGAYESRAPVAALRGHFSRAWRNTLPVSGAAIAVVPDGCVDLEWIDGTLRVAGPDREVKCETLPAGATVIGFCFCAGAATEWLGVPASEIVGARVPLDLFWGREAHRIAEWAGCAPDPGAVARRLESVLARRARDVPAPDPAASYIRHVCGRAPPQADVIRQLCAKLGVSERTLRRRCDDAFGYGPKTLQRILRFQRFFELAREGRAGVADLASAAGYADQAHLTREARRMAAMTPVAIRQQLAR